MVVALVLIALAGCGSSAKSDPADVSTSDAYNAAIRWFVSALPLTDDTSNSGPLIMFVAPASGKPIDVHAQADVAKALSDIKNVVAVRFLDDRDDAVQLDVQGQPVKDHGVLLLVSPVTSRPAPIDLHLGVYHSATDMTGYDLTIARSTDTAHPFTVTAATAVAPG